MEMDVGFAKWAPVNGLDVTIQVAEKEYKGKLFISSFNIAAITANIIKFVPDEEHKQKLLDLDNSVHTPGRRALGAFEYAEVEKPTQSPASTERVRSTSSESKSQKEEVKSSSKPSRPG